MHNRQVAVIGAGRLGTAVARLLIAAGYTVRIANSRGPESLTLQLSILLPGAIADTVDGAILKSDIIILAMPMTRYRTIDAGLLNGKIVIDAMNYWQPSEGYIAELAEGSSSSIIQGYFANANVVKTLNHVAYNELEQHSTPPGSEGRRALLMAGDDEPSKRVVAALIDTVGFDAVDMGCLDNGKMFQPDTVFFNARFTASQVPLLAAQPNV